MIFGMHNKPGSARNQIPDVQTGIHGSRNSTGSLFKLSHTSSQVQNIKRRSQNEGFSVLWGFRRMLVAGRFLCLKLQDCQAVTALLRHEAAFQPQKWRRLSRVPRKGVQHLKNFHIPDSHGAIPGSCHQQLAIRTKCHRCDTGCDTQRGGRDRKGTFWSLFMCCASPAGTPGPV